MEVGVWGFIALNTLKYRNLERNEIEVEVEGVKV